MSIHIPTAHVAEVGVLFSDTAGDAKCEMTFYVQDPTDNLFSDYPGFATQVWNAVTANLVPAFTPHTVFNGVSIEDQRSIPYAGLVFPEGPTAGSMSGSVAALPNQNSIAVKRTTGVPGRSGRGRLFWPVWDPGLLTGANAISTAYEATILAAIAAFQAAVEGGTYPCALGIVSKQTGGVARANGVFYQISGWSVTDLTIDSQRRRLPGRGA